MTFTERRIFSSSFATLDLINFILELEQHLVDKKVEARKIIGLTFGNKLKTHRSNV